MPIRSNSLTSEGSNANVGGRHSSAGGGPGQRRDSASNNPREAIVGTGAMAMSSSLPPSQLASDDFSNELLLESRRLLNDLNEENNELKETNHRLAQQLREEEDAHQATKRQLASNEKDAKQINFNLMTQLKAKTSRVKELEGQLEELAAQDSQHRREVLRVQSTMSDNNIEISALKEHIRILEEKNTQLQSQYEQAEQQASKFSAELQRALQIHRDDQLQQQQEFNVTMVQLREEGITLKESLRKAEGEAQRATAELQEIKEKHAEECAALVEEAKRNAMMESETLYAHDQMHNLSLTVHQHLVELQARVRTAALECEEQGGQLQQIISRNTDQANVIKAIYNCNASVDRAAMDSRIELETRLGDMARAVEQAKQGKMEAESKVMTLKQALDDITREVNDLDRKLQVTVAEMEEQRTTNTLLTSRLQHAEKELSESQEKGTGLKLQLAEAVSAARIATDRARTLELELTKERGQTAAERSAAAQTEKDLRRQLREEEERSITVQRRCEEEVALLRSQMNEHTNILSLALGKLSNGVPGAHSASSAKLGSSSGFSFSRERDARDRDYRSHSQATASAPRSPSRPAPAPGQMEYSIGAGLQRPLDLTSSQFHGTTRRDGPIIPPPTRQSTSGRQSQGRTTSPSPPGRSPGSPDRRQNGASAGPVPTQADALEAHLLAALRRLHSG